MTDQFDLTDDQRAIQEMARKFTADAITPFAAEWDEKHHFPRATIRQAALAFLVRRPSLFTIPKASSSEHAAENAGAGDLKLTDAEIAIIDKAFPRGLPPRELPML